MGEKAPKLSEFGQAVEAAFASRDVLVGAPLKRRELIASIEAQGMTSDEFRLVMRWWDRQTGFETTKVLRDVLAEEINWRDVAACERPRRDSEEAKAVEAAAYPNMPTTRYETNPLIRELGRHPPYSDQDAVDAFQAGLGLNLWYLAFHLGWSDDQERHDAARDGKEPAGVKRLRKALERAGVDAPPWEPPAKKSRQKGSKAAQNEEWQQRAARSLAYLRIQRGQAKPGDSELVGSWEPFPGATEDPAERRQSGAVRAAEALDRLRSQIPEGDE